MLKQFLIIAILSIISENLFCLAKDSEFSLVLKFNEFPGQSVKLGFSYGSKILFKDQISLNSEGNGFYKGIEHEGIYFLQLPDSSSFEFMITQAGYYTILSKDKKIFIQGNSACESYNKYLLFITKSSHLIDSLKRSSETTDNPDLLRNQQLKISAYKASVDSMTFELFEKHKGSLLGNYAKALLPVGYMENRTSMSSHIPDSGNFLKSIYSYKKHYFDNITFNDSRLIYTPVLENKINTYLDRMLYPSADSICVAIDTILAKTHTEEITQFIATLLLRKYSQQKNNETGELVYFHLLKDFYLLGKAPWLSSREMQLMNEEVKRIEPTLTGKKALEIILPDAKGKNCSLYDIHKEITIIVFWDYSCPNCRRILQELINVTKKYHYLDLQVYSIYTGSDVDVWKAWNYKKLPDSWINTYQDPSNPVSTQYNINFMPTLFVLDKNKIIMRKEITVPQLDEYLFLYAK